VKDGAAVPEWNLDRMPPARVVRRVPTAEAELRPTLLAISGATPAGSEVVYTVDRWLEAEGAFRATGQEFGHLEFEIPVGWEVRDVRAAGLAGWVRTGSRILVWLNHPTTDLTVRWSGSMERTGDTIDLPLPHWVNRVAGAEPLIVRIRPTTGYTVSAKQTSGMQARTSEVPNELVFTAEPTATATILVNPIPVAPPRTTEPVSKPMVPATSGVSATKTNDAKQPDDRPPNSTVWNWAPAVGWLIGLLGMLTLTALGGWKWQPECLTGIGILGLLILGSVSLLFGLFGLIVLGGVVWRIVRIVRWRVNE
jgi:hypothetical protein